MRSKIQLQRHKRKFFKMKKTIQVSEPRLCQDFFYPFLYKTNMPELNILLEYDTWPFSCGTSRDQNNQRKSVNETTFLLNLA